MAARFRVGVIGFAHMHVNMLMRDLAAQPEVEWIACADVVPDVPEPPNLPGGRDASLRYAREAIGIPRSYGDYREMLSREQLDLVLFCPENARHVEVAEAIAASGAHMVTEKPMAASLAEALRMVRAARSAGVDLFTNWPSIWSPCVQTAKALLDDGVIGDLLEVKWRHGSLGPLSHGSAGKAGDPDEVSDREKGATWWYRSGTGGGALLDYCSHGACIARYYIGEPAVAAFGLAANLASPYGSVEDNAMIGVRFPRALALLEGTWTTHDHGGPGGPILYGTRGTITVDRPSNTVRLASRSGCSSELVKVSELPPQRSGFAHSILDCLRDGSPCHPTLGVEFNLDVMAILDAGMRSVASGHLEVVDSAQWPRS